MYAQIKGKINKAVGDALEACLAQAIDKEAILSKVSLELNKTFEFGDFSSNVSLQVAKQLKTNPRALALKLIEKLQQDAALSSLCQRTEIAGPGFINFYLSRPMIIELWKEILVKKDDYGKQTQGKDKKILLEYVSANPTGPLTIAHARQAAVGDTLANILSFAGYEVLREYYLNDRGKQIEILGSSAYLRYVELLGEKIEFPADCYQGDYVKTIAQEVIDKYGDKYKENTLENLAFFSTYTKEVILAGIKQDLIDFNVVFDNYFSESEFIKGSAVDNVLQELKEKGYTEEKEGALWLKSTEFGDDKDRVLIRSNGEKTYITPDIAYHKNKFDRGYGQLINLLGPDHHGYISRLKAGVSALGYNGQDLNVIIIQLATLYQDGKKLSMSTRAGEFITLRDILDEVGKDAGRFFLVNRKTDSHLEFDLDLAKEQSSNNPVFYVQYAHARICSIFRKFKETYAQEVTELDFSQVDTSCLSETELEIIKTLSYFNKVVIDSALSFDPQKIPQYLMELVGIFHRYYNQNKVISEDKKVTQLRIFILVALKTVIKNGLTLLGISAPESM